jgi:methylthioribose-1-phosphate isomerase
MSANDPHISGAAAERRPMRRDSNTGRLAVLDQTKLPHSVEWMELSSEADAARAIVDMHVRGAPLIGAVAAAGLALALDAEAGDAALDAAVARLRATRPTAVNLAWALERVSEHVRPLQPAERAAAAHALADRICDEEGARCAAIGAHGVALIAGAAEAKRGAGPVHVLTHCNAGWLATFDYGTALAPVYKASEAGIDVHVWVDETRPLDQGSRLTAWELAQAGVPHTVIVDNAGGHLMQHGQVDLCIVGSDRTTAHGDVANKIGTYLKALAAHDNGVPFYAALPTSTIDWSMGDGVAEIPIEERAPEEVRVVHGVDAGGARGALDRFAAATAVSNLAFDVTPARYVTGLITEHGVFDASPEGLASLRDVHAASEG